MAFNKLAIASVKEELGLGDAADVAALEAGLAATDLALLGTQNDLLSTQGDVSNLQSDVGILQGDVSTLQGDVGALQTAVGTLQTDVGALQTAVGSAILTDPIAIGTGAGAISQTAKAIAIGVGAGANAQSANAVALGEACGAVNQGASSIAIGQNSGALLQQQRAIAIGVGAGGLQQGEDTIAIGTNTAQAFQQNGAVAIGLNAGGAAVSGQGASAIAIGSGAGQTDGLNDQPANSIAINATGVALLPTGASQCHIDPIREDNIVPTYVLQYDATTREVYRSNALVPAYGSFSLNTSINVLGLNVPTPLTYDTTEIASGVSFDPLNPSHIIVATSGVYKLSYSLQLDKTGPGTSQADIWIAIDGIDVPRSSSQITIQGANGETFAMCEYILNLTTSNYIEVYFTSANDTTMTASTFPAVPGVRPSVPAIITNLYRIA